ncbi:MAG: hypothetical protein IID46_14750 [Planctomycetes bacterium]|nr:hypothetical protein [Planctomycetota bacterium]
MNPQDSKTVANFLLTTLEHEAATTGRILTAVPEDRLDYRPDPVSRSALEMVRHIAVSDAWMLDVIVDLKPKNPPDESDACGIMTGAQAAAYYKAELPGRIEKLEALPAEHWTKEVFLAEAFKMPGVDFLSVMASVLNRNTPQLVGEGGHPAEEQGPSECDSFSCPLRDYRKQQAEKILSEPLE